MSEAATRAAAELGLAASTSPGQGLPPPLQPVLPDFDIIKLIGRGTFGSVWLAREKVTGVHRAVKSFSKHNSDAEIAGLCEFQRRALDHAHLVRIHLIGGSNDGYHVVMDLADDIKGRAQFDPQYYEPCSLDRMLRDRGALCPRDAVRYLREMAGAVEYLHAQGLVHRDIKPSNVLLIGGRVRLCDFGLIAPGHRAVERAGTHGYWRPDGPTDRDSDLYALTKVAFQLFSGGAVTNFPELPADLARTTSPELFSGVRELLDRGCSANPARRFSTAGALREHVERLDPEGAAPRRVSRRTTLLAGGVMLAAAAVATWALLSWRSAPFVPSAKLSVTVFPDGYGNPNALLRHDPAGLLTAHTQVVSTNANPQLTQQRIRYVKVHTVCEPASYMAMFWIAPDGDVLMIHSDRPNRTFFHPVDRAYRPLPDLAGNYVICAFFSHRPFRYLETLRAELQTLARSRPNPTLPHGTMRVLSIDQTTPVLIGDSEGDRPRDDFGLLGAIRGRWGDQYPVIGIEIPLNDTPIEPDDTDS